MAIALTFCYLAASFGIREPGQLRTPSIRGALFKSWIASGIVMRDARGTTRQLRSDTQLLPWHEIDQLTMTHASSTP